MLRRLPEAMREEMADAMVLAGRDITNAQRADAPVKTGRLRAGISYKVNQKTLKLRAGLLGKPINRRLFYGRIIEFGRKAQTVMVNRRIEAGSALVNRRRVAHPPYRLRVKARRGRPFIYRRRPELMNMINRRLKQFWTRVLSDASRGIGLE
jgi:hypothetical protein